MVYIDGRINFESFLYCEQDFANDQDFVDFEYSSLITNAGVGGDFGGIVSDIVKNEIFLTIASEITTVALVETVKFFYKKFRNFKQSKRRKKFEDLQIINDDFVIKVYINNNEIIINDNNINDVDLEFAKKIMSSNRTNINQT